MNITPLGPTPQSPNAFRPLQPLISPESSDEPSNLKTNKCSPTPFTSSNTYQTPTPLVSLTPQTTAVNIRSFATFVGTVLDVRLRGQRAPPRCRSWTFRLSVQLWESRFRALGFRGSRVQGKSEFKLRFRHYGYRVGFGFKSSRSFRMLPSLPSKQRSPKLCHPCPEPLGAERP